MINEIELSKSFEDIFTSEEVEDFYEKWHDKKLEERDKRSWLAKYWYLLPMIALVVFMLCNIFYMESDHVTQKVIKTSSGDARFGTMVWVDNEIVQSWWTDVDKVTDSLKEAQRREGERILKAIK